MIEQMHSFINHVVGGADGDLAWAGVRAITSLCSLFAAWAVRYSRDRYLIWAACGLGIWLILKVVDDLTRIGIGPALTVYFTISNLLWCSILIGLSRMAKRERKCMQEHA